MDNKERMNETLVCLFFCLKEKKNQKKREIMVDKGMKHRLSCLNMN